MGMSGLAWSRFAMLNFIAAGVWAVCFAVAGYLAGMALQHVLGDLATGFGLLMLAAFLIVILVLFKMSRRRPSPSQPATVPATVPNRNVPAQAE
jgi:membrane protein DedA with SNARE-associated domain